jgi:hypothetical protein
LALAPAKRDVFENSPAIPGRAGGTEIKSPVRDGRFFARHPPAAGRGRHPAFAGIFPPAGKENRRFFRKIPGG